MPENQELEALDHLVSSDGWRLLSEIVQRTYGRSSDRFFDAVTQAAKSDNVHAQDHLRQIIAEQRGALDVLAIPVNRLKVLRGAPKPDGSKLELVGQSRRGNL